MSARRRRPARFGPFHRKSGWFPDEIEKICGSNEIRGKPRGNFFAGLVPAVKAWDGELPEGIVGVEFYTDIEPDPDGVPGSPEWSEGRPGVRVLERNELVAIDVIVTKRHDSE
jgi:hypothetical protein